MGVKFTGLPQARIPAATPENFVCMRGPCRHYWRLVSDAHLGNPEETLVEIGIKGQQVHHTCTVNPGTETSFADNVAYECSRWDPMTPREIKKIASRRKAFWRRNDPTEGAL